MVYYADYVDKSYARVARSRANNLLGHTVPLGTLS
jgi:hypothetical protein